MAILSASTYSTYTGTSYTGADATALAAIISAVDAAIKRTIRPFYPESTTVTDAVLDAPVGPVLLLPVVPVRSITSLYLNYSANGVVADFTSDHLLMAGDDYHLPLDGVVEGYSRSGRVFRRGASSWGRERVFMVDRIAPQTTPARGAIKATFAAGPTSVPDDLVQAAVLATSLLFHRKVAGAPFGSESWNGYSAGIAGPFTAAGVLRTPDIAALLAPYQTVHFGVA